MTAPKSRPRRNNRREQLLDAAAVLFVEKGFNGTSTREIAKATGMLPGSLYYHFPSKEDLLVAVFEEGVQRISACVDAALASAEMDPWARLQKASEAHLSMLLGGSNYAHVVVRVLPTDVPGAKQSLVELRNDYEARFIALFDALPLRADTDRSILRLMLIGALNHAPVWYREGQNTPEGLAQKFINVLHCNQHNDAGKQNGFQEDKK